MCTSSSSALRCSKAGISSSGNGPFLGFIASLILQATVHYPPSAATIDKFPRVCFGPAGWVTTYVFATYEDAQAKFRLCRKAATELCTYPQAMLTTGLAQGWPLCPLQRPSTARYPELWWQQGRWGGHPGSREEEAIGDQCLRACCKRKLKRRERYIVTSLREGEAPGRIC